MCLVIFFGVLIVIVMVTFVKSALILLPWTIGASILACFTGIGLGKLFCRTRESGVAVSMATTFIMTIVLGYLGYLTIPPTAPPQKQGIELFLHTPEPSQQQLWDMLPIHLTIFGIIGAIIVSRFWYRWSPEMNLDPENGVYSTPGK